MGAMELEVQKAGLARAILGENDEAVIKKLWLVLNDRKTAVYKRKKSVGTVFADSFGMWADRDVDIKQIRQRNRERRTKSYGDGTL